MTELDKFLGDLKARDNWNTSKLLDMIGKRPGLGVSMEKDDAKRSLKEMFHFVNDVRVGDIITFPIIGVHPALIFKVEKNIVHAAIMSSTRDTYGIVYKIEEDRHLKGSFVTNTIVSVDKEKAILNWIGSLETNREMPFIKNVLKKSLDNLFSIRKKFQDIEALVEEVL